MLGVHAAAMGGTWQALVFGFLGVRFTEAGPQVHANAKQMLSPDWPRIELSLAWRGRSHKLEVAQP